MESDCRLGNTQVSTSGSKTREIKPEDPTACPGNMLPQWSPLCTPVSLCFRSGACWWGSGRTWSTEQAGWVHGDPSLLYSAQ
jgi:hypothetical protein